MRAVEGHKWEQATADDDCDLTTPEVGPFTILDKCNEWDLHLSNRRAFDFGLLSNA